jgi:hypothetical protein
MKSLIITNCTSRKKIKVSANIKDICTAKKHTIEQLSSRWVDYLKTQSTNIPAIELYAGKSISDIKKASKILNSEIKFVSAGFGLLDSTDYIPSYEATITAKSTLSNLLLSINHQNKDWWSILNKTRNKKTHPISTLINRGRYDLVLISLPGTYLEFIHDDLAAIKPENIPKLRIFSHQSAINLVPQKCIDSFMPYDDRFEDPCLGYRGTKINFPHRSTLHFVKEIKGYQYKLKYAKKLVQSSLLNYRKPNIPERTKLSDEEILRELDKYWKKYLGQSGKLFRHLKDDALIACEQSRFRKLWNLLRETNGVYK